MEPTAQKWPNWRKCFNSFVRCKCFDSILSFVAYGLLKSFVAEIFPGVIEPVIVGAVILCIFWIAKWALIRVYNCIKNLSIFSSNDACFIIIERRL